MNESVTTANFVRHQELKATIITACPHCHAPGLYTDHQDVADNWSGCYVKSGSCDLNKPVGDICPNCGNTRLPDKPLGTIWEKWVFASWWQKFKYDLSKWWQK